MNKSQLIKILAKTEKLTIKRSKEIVNNIFFSIENALLQNNRVEIRGFGSFKVKKYDSYYGRNPKTGESIKVDSKKMPLFKVGKDLYKKVAFRK